MRHIITNIAVFLSMVCLAQDSIVLVQVDSVTAFNVDAKENYYISDKSNTLYKFDRKGKLITNVNSKVYGSIESIDCTNPFEVYVYHKDQNILVFYDNMFNMRGELRFSELGLSNVACVARSYDNQIWAYDYTAFQLQKINKEGVTQASSGNLSNFIDANISPYKIIEYKEKVYLADSLNGILVFDMFGTYLKTIPLLHSFDFDVLDQTLVALSKEGYTFYNMLNFDMKKLNLKQKFPVGLTLQSFGLFFCSGKTIFKYPSS